MNVFIRENALKLFGLEAKELHEHLGVKFSCVRNFFLSLQAWEKKTISGICVSAARENKISRLAVGLMLGSLSPTLMSHPVEVVEKAATSWGVQPEFMSITANQLSRPHFSSALSLFTSCFCLASRCLPSLTYHQHCFSVLSDISFSERSPTEPSHTHARGTALPCLGVSQIFS